MYKILEDLKEIRITNQRIMSQLEEVYTTVTKLHQDNATGLIDNETTARLLETELEKHSRLVVQLAIVKTRNNEIEEILNALEAKDFEYIAQCEPQRIA